MSLSLVTGLTGCASSISSATSGPSHEAVSAPPMEGPWADVFAAEWEAATTDVERSVLADGVVSDQEYAEMTETFRDCLDDQGIDFTGFSADGSFETSVSPSRDPDEANEAVKSCSRAAGEDSIGMLYSWVNRNPERLDDNTIVVRCLQDEGVVGAAYTAADYADDIDSEEYPFVVDEQTGLGVVSLCESDPLGLLGLRS